MSFQFRLEKVMAMKEKEQEKAQRDYQEAIEQFDKVATKLYELLKRKEDLETLQQKQLLSGMSVQQMKHHQQFIANLERSIDYFQGAVRNARTRMYWQEEQLKEKQIEVKKYEKVKEQEFKKFIEIEKQQDMREMDEISIFQYVYRSGS
ncbi:flagellar export protein FliJ [Aeribacillus pallidus]|uniref:flagellar export protein FliJ n=1 Tax=Aeribacillus pallidus TaxID=33936 RepID=UPI003D1FA992